MQLLNELVNNTSISEPLLHKVGSYEGVIEMSSVVINDCIKANNWCLRVFLDVENRVTFRLVLLELVVTQVCLLKRQLLNQDCLKHLLLLQLTKVFSCRSRRRLVIINSIFSSILYSALFILFSHLLLAEPFNLEHVMLSTFLLILRVKLLLHALNERVEQAEKHDEQAEVGKVRLTVRPRKDVLEEHSYLHLYIKLLIMIIRFINSG